MIEHDQAVMAYGAWIIDLGPGAGCLVATQSFETEGVRFIRGISRIAVRHPCCNIAP